MAVTIRAKPLLRQGFLYNRGMPTYQYICENGHEYEEIRGMSEEQRVSTCTKEGCDAKLKRKFGTPPITFKGGGFHATRG